MTYNLTRLEPVARSSETDLELLLELILELAAIYFC